MKLSSSAQEPPADAVSVVELPDVAVKERPFVNSEFGASKEVHAGIRVELIARQGKTVYAGACVHLELVYSRKGEDGSFVDVRFALC
jgi:hypothetical protein